MLMIHGLDTDGKGADNLVKAYYYKCIIIGDFIKIFYYF